MCYDELDCATNAVALHRTILNDAARLTSPAFAPGTDDPELELRRELPLLLARLSAPARAMLEDHLDHMAEMVAFMHRASHHIAADSNLS